MKSEDDEKDSPSKTSQADVKSKTEGGFDPLIALFGKEFMEQSNVEQGGDMKEKKSDVEDSR